jgi:hypothetical protein
MRSHSLTLAALLALAASGGSLTEPAASSLGTAMGEAVLEEPEETPNPGYFGSGHQSAPVEATSAPGS